MRTRHRYRGHRRSVMKSKSTLSRSRYSYARLKLYNIIWHTKIVSPAILYTRNPIATAVDWQSAVCPLSSSDSRAQLLINYICYTYYYTILLRIGPRGNDDIIYFTLSPLRHSQFFLHVHIIYTHKCHRRVYRTVNTAVAAARADYIIIIILYTNDRRRRIYRQLVYRIEIEHHALHSSSWCIIYTRAHFISCIV